MLSSSLLLKKWVPGGVVDPHHFNADPDSTYHPVADPDPDFYLIRIRIRLFTLIQIDLDPSCQINAQSFEKC